MRTTIIKCLVYILCYTIGYGQNDTIIIQNVNVIPMHQEVVWENQTVAIANGKILKVAPSTDTLVRKSAKIIDGSGKYLIPGLSEMHYHWRNKEGGIARDFKLLLANGVTTVRNMAEYDWQDHVAIRDSINSNLLMGPNYYTAGPYLQSGDLKTSADVERFIKQHHKKGYDFIKIADNLPKDIYFEVLEQAAAYKIPVMGHAQREMDLEYSLRMKSIEHVEEFVYLFSDEYRKDSLFLKKAVQQIKNSGITIAPTLVVFDMIVKCLDDNFFEKLKEKEAATYMLKGDYGYWSSEENPYRQNLKGKVINGKDALPLLEGYFKWMMKFTKMLAKEDVPMMTGSDTFGFVVPGFSLHEEFQFLHEAGLSPYEILKASTMTPARYLGSMAMEGTISEGKNANMVLLNKNPLKDIKNTKTIEGVILKGKWLDRDQLDVLLEEVELVNNKIK
ncbi:amidohydrolase [Allomuricauda ruestringensis DSM 13258]|uniref:Amidohydrolase n=1 Tax=Allomuricauda ruestringensis (strain DSM 13258 / CIP 107369 / LMG 19739 / B1) TaxID=886377 RepID=G2PIB4_ALLRU|nr:amidohydrolase family protein [Allomuricauda ruestringensis]AEM71732.1 amidohydrolase [Allomuricauda ruestringensis DSM 13258]